MAALIYRRVMVEPALIATPAQRRRALALALFCVALTAAGLASRGVRSGATPAPCRAPAMVDGALVCDGQGAPAGARAWLAGERLDVNGATLRELEAIPGVGPSLARAIVETRAARGGFTALDQLDEVPGIGEKTLAKLARYLRVAPAE